jgi:hypothetical protein
MNAVKTVFAAALLAAAALAVRAAGLPPQYAGTPTARDYPGADALVLSESRHFTLGPDGRVTEHFRTVQKILTYQGMDEIGDPKIAFNKENQTLTIDLCRTYTPEGKVVDAKANSFNEMTPYELEKSPAYTGWREMVVTKVGLDVNAVVEFEYTIADTKAWRPFLEGEVMLQGTLPALSREIAVTVPAGKDVKSKLLNMAGQPTTVSEAGQVTTTWIFKKVPLLNVMAVSAMDEAFAPMLAFTTAPAWNAHADRVGALVQKAIAATSPALDKKTDELLKGLQDPFERTAKLQSYVAEYINNVDWPLAAFEFEPRTAAQVFETGYGHGLDKAVLLCAMLKRAGVSCAIAAGRRLPEGAEDPTTVPCMALFDRTVIHAEPGKATLWLDPTAPLAESSQRNLYGMKGLPLLPGFNEIHTMPPLDAADQLLVNAEAALAADLSLEGTATVSLGGGYSPYYKVQGSKDDQKAVLGKVLSSLLPGASAGDFSVVRMEPGLTVFQVAFKAPAPEKGNLKVLRTGLPEGSLLNGVRGIYLQERALPLVLAHPGSEKVYLKLKLAEGQKAAYIPAPITRDSPGASFRQSWTAKADSLEMSLESAVPKTVVQPRDYPAFRAVAASANSASSRLVIFE